MSSHHETQCLSDDEFLSEALLDCEQALAQDLPFDCRAACQDRPHLIERLQSRFEDLRRMNAMLDGHADVSLDTSLQSSGDDNPFSSPRSNKHLETQGQYEIVRRHARGGLGEVLVAHQTQPSRSVAIKVMRPPFDRNPTQRQRFLREAEITARLQHPGIVPVYGMGLDPEGRPCYAMRFVEGDTLQSAIEQFHQRLPSATTAQIQQELRELLRRLISVCNTIAFAHDRGIVHRDIKPNNILLGKFHETLVVDWGLAKDLAAASIGEAEAESHHAESHQEVGDLPQANAISMFQPSPPPSDSSSPLTQSGSVMGTPSYMSPEQSSGREQLTYASDIYSLGATLSTILSGRHPRPSLFIREGSAPQECEPSPKLARMRLRPLVAVCNKAMRLQPEQRYRSPLELASDLERWLSDEPVSVYRGDVGERLSRWIRQHRTWATAVSVIAFVIIASLAILALQMSIANQRLVEANEAANQSRRAAMAASALAKENAKIADEQSRVAVTILHQVIEDIQRQLIQSPATQQVRRTILEKSMNGLAQVQASIDLRPEVDRNVMLARLYLADVYAQIGNDADLGGLRAASEQLMRARDIALQLLKQSPDNELCKQDLALVLNRLGTLASQIGTAAEAESYWKESFRLRESIYQRDPSQESHLLGFLNAANTLGDYYVRDRSLSQAESLYGRAFAVVSDRLEFQHSPEMERSIEVTLNNYASLKLRQGTTDDAIALLRQSLERSRQRYRVQPDDRTVRSDLAFVLTMLGRALWTKGDYANVEPLYREAYALREMNYRNEPTNTRSMLHYMQGNERMGGLMLKVGRVQEAREYFLTMQRMCQALVEQDPNNLDAIRNLSVASERIATVLWELGQREESLAYFADSLQSDRDRLALDPSDPRTKIDVADSLASYGSRLIELDRASEARKMLEEASETYQAHLENNPMDYKSMRSLAELLRQLARARQAAREWEPARDLFSESLQWLDRIEARDPNNDADRWSQLTTRYDLGCVEQLIGDRDRARSSFIAAEALLQRLRESSHAPHDLDEWSRKIQQALLQLGNE